MAYGGYFKDASVSNTLKTVVHWSHNWVVGCVTLRPKRWPKGVIGLPVWFSLYRKRSDCDRRCPFMLATLRSVLWTHRIKRHSPLTGRIHE